jgi:hypothetical protein
MFQSLYIPERLKVMRNPQFQSVQICFIGSKIRFADQATIYF